MHLRKRLNLWAMARAALPLLLTPGDRSPTVPDWHDARDGEGQGHERRRDADFIRFHYDVGNDFYGLFLDPSMIYSSAVFPHEGAGLEEAQRHKLDLICRKLNLKPGQRLLDIGCGWGGLACHAARHYGARVQGVTLSPAQLEYGRAEVARQGLGDRVTLELVDYRDIDVEGVYDAVSQVEMFEHLGFRNHDAHFARVRRLLKPGGVVDRLTAPGGVLDRLTQEDGGLMRAIEPGGLVDQLLDEEGLVERVLAEDGLADRLLAEGGLIDKLTARNGPLEQLADVADTLNRLAPGLEALEPTIEALREAVIVLSQVVNPLSNIADRIPFPGRRPRSRPVTRPATPQRIIDAD
ncbi:SAM-dependent methyltransferase [Mycolicibacterium poriferae]|uniref:SAM-dependent methyltransferase n=1 Tax=Mycolicibacterium poriferae TaxID=39694 RepID=UPI003D2F28AC